MKAFYLPRESNQKKFETRFCRRKTTEGNNVKINVSMNIPCTFLLFEARVFLLIIFPRKTSFEVLHS